MTKVILKRIRRNLPCDVGAKLQRCSKRKFTEAPSRNNCNESAGSICFYDKVLIELLCNKCQCYFGSENNFSFNSYSGSQNNFSYDSYSSSQNKFYSYSSSQNNLSYNCNSHDNFSPRKFIILEFNI